MEFSIHPHLDQRGHHGCQQVNDSTDPIRLILTSLTAGAAKAAAEAAPDLYKGLKALIQRRFAGIPTAEMVLAEYEIDPLTYGLPLKKTAPGRWAGSG